MDNTRKIHTKVHPGLEWRIFHILSSEDMARTIHALSHSNIKLIPSLHRVISSIYLLLHYICHLPCPLFLFFYFFIEPYFYEFISSFVVVANSKSLLLWPEGVLSLENCNFIYFCPVPFSLSSFPIRLSSWRCDARSVPECSLA